MLGDNRDRSLDSRYWGFVDVSDVVGLATIIYASVDMQTADGRPYEYSGLDQFHTEPAKRTIRWNRIGTIIH